MSDTIRIIAKLIRIGLKFLPRKEVRAEVATSAVITPAKTQAMLSQAEIDGYTAWLVKEFGQFNQDLDFSVESVRKVEDFFNTQAENGESKLGSFLEQNEEKVVLAVGFYLGEVIKRVAPNSTWVFEGEVEDFAPSKMMLQVNKSLSISPMRRVMSRLYNGPEENLYFYVRIIINQLTK